MGTGRSGFRQDRLLKTLLECERVDLPKAPNLTWKVQPAEALQGISATTASTAQLSLQLTNDTHNHNNTRQRACTATPL
jgi:hypothetical protein